MVLLLKILLAMVIFKAVTCQWTMDVRLQATLVYLAEVRNGLYCCCDNLNPDNWCREELTNLPDCTTDIFTCDTRVTIMLSGCSQCPGVCCDVVDIGSSINVNITSPPLLISETSANMSEILLQVVMEDIDQGSVEDPIDNFNVLIPLQKTDTFVHPQSQTGVNGIAEIIVSYRIRYNSEQISSDTTCNPSSALISDTNLSSSPSCPSMTCPIMGHSTVTTTVIEILSVSTSCTVTNEHFVSTVTHTVSSYESTNSTCTTSQSYEMCIHAPLRSVSDAQIPVACITVAIVTTLLAVAATTLSIIMGCFLCHKRVRTKSHKISDETGIEENQAEDGAEQFKDSEYHMYTSIACQHDYAKCLSPMNQESDVYMVPASPYETPQVINEASVST